MTARSYGRVLGHRASPHSDEPLPYETARRFIHLPAYRWVLHSRAADLVAELRDLTRGPGCLLLDSTTNGDATDTTTPLSHAALVIRHIEDRWPLGTPDAADSRSNVADAQKRPQTG